MTPYRHIEGADLNDNDIDERIIPTLMKDYLTPASHSSDIQGVPSLRTRLARRAIPFDKAGNKFIEKGEKGLKTPYRSELGYTQNRGGGTQYVHRVYPENDSYYIDMQYNEEGLYPEKSKRFIYNPTNAEFNYDDYDYSNTVPAKKYDLNSNENGVYQFFNNENAASVIERLKGQNYQLVTPIVRGTGTPSGYRGTRIYK